MLSYPAAPKPADILQVEMEVGIPVAIVPDPDANLPVEEDILRPATVRLENARVALELSLELSLERQLVVQDEEVDTSHTPDASAAQEGSSRVAERSGALVQGVEAAHTSDASAA
jgi:hypothetical protein